MNPLTDARTAHNPYAAPVADDPKPVVPTRDNLAGNGRRLLTFAVDYVGITVCAGMIGFVVGLVGGPAADALTAGGNGVGTLFGFVIMIVYYLGFEASCGRTPGKMLAGTRVVTLTGEPPRFGQIVGRTFARMVPFEPFSFFGDNAGGWHDSWTDTRVIRTR